MVTLRLECFGGPLDGDVLGVPEGASSVWVDLPGPCDAALLRSPKAPPIEARPHGIYLVGERHRETVLRWAGEQGPEA